MSLPAGGAAALPATATGAGLRRLFQATVLLGSFLLFLVQPMFARLVLPSLGGAPAVWNSALLFYQAALLGGYLWAHALARLPARTQLILHLGLFALAGLSLPIAVADVPSGWAAASPALWLPVLFALSIGPVFVAVAAQAPLMQAWFARTGQPPWFLYAASNLGSLLALLAYPLIVEPWFGVGWQTMGWSGLYLALAAAMAACGWATLRLPPPPEPVAVPPTPWRVRLRWGALAAVPAGLLIAVTNWLSTDIMAMPLIWVVPLAIYLATYILAFARGHGRILMPDLGAALTLLAVGGYVFLATGAMALIAASASLVLFFYVALSLHGALARSAPPPARATEFYLWVALGGVVGGLLPALIAPTVFDWTYEFPLLLVAAALLIPAPPLVPSIDRLWRGRVSGPVLRYAAPVAAAGLAWWAGSRITNAAGLAEAGWAAGVIGVFAVLAIGRPLAFAFHLAALLLALGGLATLRTSAVEGARQRSFFGIYTVQQNSRNETRELMHGTTLHGAQSLVEGYKRTPTTYYAPYSGVGRVLSRAPILFEGPARIGVVGLGTGTLACYRQPGQRYIFFEIDPAVSAIARDPRRFSYLARCAPDAAIVIGDARLTIAERPPGSLDILAVDAFSSDAIPVHLLTREAMAVYGRALAPDGLLLIHISNRFVDLEPVVASIARAEGWSAVQSETFAKRSTVGLDDATSDWVLLARSPERLEAALGTMPAGEWRPLEAPAGFRLWTDDYASLLPVLKWRTGG